MAKHPPAPKAADARPAAAEAVDVEQTQRKKLAAADYFSALRRSLDGLQRQLSDADNAFADFIVKEFKIEAAVQMEINDLGVLQFVMADDAMPAQAVSRISLTLGAVAKAEEQSPSRNLTALDRAALGDLTWLPPRLADELARYEIRTAAEFLGLVADARFTTQITTMLKTNREEIGRWANQTRLLQLPEMTASDIELLAQFQIYSLADLGKLDEKSIAAMLRKAGRWTEILLIGWRDAAISALG